MDNVVLDNTAHTKWMNSEQEFCGTPANCWSHWKLQLQNLSADGPSHKLTTNAEGMLKFYTMHIEDLMHL